MIIIASIITFLIGVVFIIIGKRKKLSMRAGIFICIAAGCLTFVLPLQANNRNVNFANEAKETNVRATDTDIDLGELSLRYKDSKFKRYQAILGGLKKDTKYNVRINVYAMDAKGNKKERVTFYDSKFSAPTNDKFYVFYEIDTSKLYREHFIFEHEVNPA